MEENFKKGGISVETSHIFPIIKKWLYSEKDIFLREIVSNASDAVTKLKRLASLGKYDANDEQYFVKVVLDKESKTITVSDNGIGMTEEELEKYICSIALSGALDFIQKYDEHNNNSGIIGHFGLGFYSSFMVSDKVEVITKSYTDSPAIHWVCDGSGEYEITSSDKETHGTDVIMHISDEESEYLDKYKVQNILEKYCSFMSVNIYFSEVNDDESEKDGVPEEVAPINDASPLWLKNPSDCTDEEYNDFYKKVFSNYKEPLFHIHINADYPLNFKGILYFPTRANEYESYEGQIKLFYNQVFVADDIKDIIPEYLLMLRGVLDCPELPLNVSRSYLQDSAYVKKVANHIVKKVADKLSLMCANDREKYESIWSKLKIFVEYASLRDRKFFDRVKSSYLLELTDNTYLAVDDYLKDCEETHKNTVYYATDKEVQAQYVSLYESQGYKIAILPDGLDTQFVSMWESVNSEVKFKRVDADVDLLKETDGEVDSTLESVFKTVSGNDNLKIEFQALKDKNIPAILTVSEESRRLESMMKMYADMGMGMNTIPVEYTFIVNTSSELISKLTSIISDNEEKGKLMASEIYKLALLSQRRLTADELKSFMSDSFAILGLL